jgi:2-polyprenyl-3-methyl-5-hydroxy-6-metoxy-1,4-benzoquinol methylase
MDMTNKLKRLDAIASQSDHSRGFEGLVMVYIFNAIVESLTGRHLLELGCRGGRMTGLLASVCDTLDVVDGSRIYIERAHETVWANNVNYHWSLFEDFEPTNRYSDIIMIGGLDHVDGPVAFLQRISNFLEPGGAVHIVVPNAMSMHRRLGVKMQLLKGHNELNDRDRWVGHLRVYGPSSLRRDIEAAGLAVTHFDGIFLKPLATGQLIGLGQQVLDALYDLGKELPEWCSHIYMRAQLMDHFLELNV